MSKDYMFVLVLEDDPNNTRMTQFYDRFDATYGERGIRIVCDHVKTAAECIEKLKTKSYALVLLDHDLGGKTPKNNQECEERMKDEDCGSRVAEFLRDNPDVRRRHGLYIVHSLNHIAARWMVLCIKDRCYAVPSAWTRDVWEKINIP